MAAYFGLYELTRNLLEERRNDINAVDSCGASVLHWAAGQGHQALVELLVENKADIEKHELGGGTPLTRAIDSVTGIRDSAFNPGGIDKVTTSEQEAEAIVRLLLKNSAQVNYNYVVRGPRLVRYIEIDENSKKTLKEVIMGEQSISVRNYRTPLMRAVESAILQELLDHGADVDARNDVGLTALHWARRTSKNGETDVHKKGLIPLRVLATKDGEIYRLLVKNTKEGGVLVVEP